MTLGYNNRVICAGVMELADVLDSKSSGSDTVPVRPRSPAPKKSERKKRSDFFIFKVYFIFNKLNIYITIMHKNYHYA